ncbi:hypothetical protein HBH47_075620 [Parastagonospora nodorum]|nr:hypothetical protein HBH47_075620 [Parastagonospora nodorum]KAH4196773.1 hypothetical protein HBH42_069920 [Parastagonospora nodorum]KAH5119687.1 hypothetical protein HBH71_081350 [Parastagonospora nodorum]
MLKKCLKVQLDEEICVTRTGKVHDPAESLKKAREDIFGEMLDLEHDQRQLNEVQAASSGSASGSKLRKVQELTREQEAELESLVSIIGQPIARALPFLTSNDWNLDDAISAYYQSLDDKYSDEDEDEDEDDFDEEEIARAVKNSQDDLLKDDYFTTSPGGPGGGGSQPSKSTWSANPNQAGSSGVKKLPKLTEQEEMLELQAARDKLDRLVQEERQSGGNNGTGREERDNDSDNEFGASKDVIEFQKATNPELIAIQARIVKMQQTNTEVEKRKQSFSPMLTEFLQHMQENNQSLSNPPKAIEPIRESVESDARTPTKRPSLQTALDVINSKKRVSSGHPHGQSPTKKKREGQDYSNFGAQDTSWETPQPYSGTAMADRLPTDDSMDEPLDFDTKYSILVSMDLGDEELCMQQLLQNEGDLERTKTQLHSLAYLHKLDTGELEVPDEVNQDKGKGVDEQQPDVFQAANHLAILRSMHLASDKRCLEALQVTRGDLARAIDILRMEAAAAISGPPPPASPTSHPSRQLPPPASRPALPNLDYFDLNQADPATFGQSGESNIQQPHGGSSQISDEWQRTLDTLKGNIATAQRRLTPSPPPVSEESLATLHAMGFYDHEKNIEMLEACGGDVGMTVEELLKPDTSPEEERASSQLNTNFTRSGERKKQSGIHLGGWNTQPVANERRTNSFPPMPDTAILPELAYEGKGKGGAVDAGGGLGGLGHATSSVEIRKDERKDSKNDEESQSRNEEGGEGDVEMRGLGVE